jgi:hypothetical protein
VVVTNRHRVYALFCVSAKYVLISGTGIAGPALAPWLLCYGFAPTLVERAPHARIQGYAIVLGRGLRHRREDGSTAAGAESRLLRVGRPFHDGPLQPREVSEDGKAMAARQSSRVGLQSVHAG